MSSKVKDEVFGEMTFLHPWVKKEEITLFGKIQTVRIAAAAFVGEGILDRQRDSYRFFKENIDKVSEKCEKALIEYVRKYGAEFYPYCPELAKADDTELVGFIVLKTVLFRRDGSVVLMFDAKWDEENGVGIQVYPDVKIGWQANFL